MKGQGSLHVQLVFRFSPTRTWPEVSLATQNNQLRNLPLPSRRRRCWRAIIPRCHVSVATRRWFSEDPLSWFLPVSATLTSNAAYQMPPHHLNSYRPILKQCNHRHAPLQPLNPISRRPVLKRCSSSCVLRQLLHCSSHCSCLHGWQCLSHCTVVLWCSFRTHNSVLHDLFHHQ